MGARSATEQGVIAAEMIRARAQTVLETEAAAISGEDDGVHQHRSQVRRLRDVLAATRTSSGPARERPLGPALAAWGRILGQVRDAEVRAAVADEALTALGMDAGPVRARLVDAERAEYERLLRRLGALRREPRFQELFARLRALSAAEAAGDASPAGRDDAPHDVRDDAEGGRGDAFVQSLLRAEARRVGRAARRLDGSDHAYHRLRKAARRLRSVTVAAADATDADDEGARRLAKAAKRIHGNLGAHRDQRLFVERLERARTHGVRAGEPAAEYDALLTQARDAADEGLHALRRSVDRVRKAAKKLA